MQAQAQEPAPAPTPALTSRSATPRRRNRAQVSCTECRRRKQKCNPRKDGPCANCIRRYPPVECYVLPDPRAPKQNPPTNVTPAAVDFSNRLPPLPKPDNSNSRGFRDGEYYLPLPPIQDPWNHDHRAHQTPSSYQASKLNHQTSGTYPKSTRFREIPIFTNDSESSDNSSEESSNPDTRIALRRSPSPFGSPRPFGGVLRSVNTLNGLPIEPTPRNAELFCFFHEYVVPNLCSVDGQAIPALFAREMLPWMIQSPLMPNIAILMAAATQGEHGLEVTKHSDTLRIKTRVLGLINEFLKQDFRVVGGEALRAVIHLVVLEWFWGTPAMIWPHMLGMKQMMKLRGGFPGMNDPVLQQVIILTDYELANCFERELFLLDHDSGPEHDMPIPVFYGEKFRSPLIAYPSTFGSDREYLDIDELTAEILDDIRFLTLSITSHDANPKDIEKIRSTALWLNKRLESLPIVPVTPNIPTAFIIYNAVHLTARIFTAAISKLSPTSTIYTSMQILELHSYLSLVGLTRWKDMPGILLWILLVATPSAENNHQGRYLRRKMAVTGMSIGMEDFGLAIGQLRGFWKVQRWIANRGMMWGKSV